MTKRDTQRDGNSQLGKTERERVRNSERKRVRNSERKNAWEIWKWRFRETMRIAPRRKWEFLIEKEKGGLTGGRERERERALQIQCLTFHLAQLIRGVTLWSSGLWLLSAVITPPQHRKLLINETALPRLVYVCVSARVCSLLLGG